MTAEATGAREALMRLLSIVERHLAGHIVRSVGATHEPADNEDRQYNDLMQLIVDVEEGLGGDSRPNGEAGAKVAPNNPQTPAPSPTPSAPPEADGRVWWHVIDSDGNVSVANSEQTAAKWAATWSISDNCEYTVVPVVPRSELARVQRERDEARDTAAVRQGQLKEARDKRFFWESACRRAENAMVRETQEKYEAIKELATLRAQLATAEQKLDTAKKSLCGLLDPDKTMFCSKDSLVNEVERIVSTLGRAHVADTEER